MTPRSLRALRAGYWTGRYYYMIRTIGVVGAGTMGNGIAQVFTQAGFEVRLVDASAPALDRARATIEKSLGKFVEKGKLSAADRDAALATARDDDRPRDAGGQRLRRRSDLRGSPTPSASCSRVSTRSPGLTSSSRRTPRRSRSPRSAAATRRPGSVLGMHFMNPVPLMTLVELIRGQATSAETMAIGIGAVQRDWARRQWRRPTTRGSSPTAS